MLRSGAETGARSPQGHRPLFKRDFLFRGGKPEVPDRWEGSFMSSSWQKSQLMVLELLHVQQS